MIKKCKAYSRKVMASFFRTRCSLLWLQYRDLSCLMHTDRLQHIPHIATKWQSGLRPRWGWSYIGSFVATSTGLHYIVIVTNFTQQFAFIILIYHWLTAPACFSTTCSCVKLVVRNMFLYNKSSGSYPEFKVKGLPRTTFVIFKEKCTNPKLYF